MRPQIQSVKAGYVLVEKNDMANLKIAVIPWSEKFMHNRMFDLDNMDVNRDNLMVPFARMRQEFEKNGDIFQTIDMFDLNEVDYFLFFIMNYKLVREINQIGKADRMIYCNAEPPVVDESNTPKGYRFIKRFFPYIMTWNDDWVDNETIFKRNIPYYFEPNFGTVPFKDRKLVTFISGNKKSNHPDELYSERERAIEYFESHYTDNFDFYGTGWDKNKYSCYGGRAENKAEIYHNYRFAICYENMHNIKGYITEKILDCLCSGIVPIYCGASNICEYVPKECFILLDDFVDYAELAKFIANMDETTYNEYLEAAKKFLDSDLVDKFKGEDYARYVYKVIDKKKKFAITPLNKVYLNYICSRK
jgi:hypothetical protein